MATIFQGKFDKHQTLRERIADTLRDAIIHGRVKPGEKISEPDLAAKFGISRTPIREALRQLETEGFLEVSPRKGARIASITEKDVSDFYELKSVLEGYAARLATTRLSDKEIDKMESINEQMEKLSVEKDWKQVFRLHNEFHDIFLRACGNDQLYQTVTLLVKKFQRFRILLAMDGKTEGSVVQHRAIVAAFRKRDAVLTEKLTAENAMFGKDTIIKEVLKDMHLLD